MLKEKCLVAFWCFFSITFWKMIFHFRWHRGPPYTDHIQNSWRSLCVDVTLLVVVLSFLLRLSAGLLSILAPVLGLMNVLYCLWRKTFPRRLRGFINSWVLLTVVRTRADLGHPTSIFTARKLQVSINLPCLPLVHPMEKQRQHRFLRFLRFTVEIARRRW